MSQQSFHQQTANGSNIAFTITTFSEDEIKVYVDGVESTNGGSSQNDYTIPNYTTSGGTVTWNTSGSLTAPASPSVVRVIRQTDVMNNGNTAVEGKATFQAGSSVKAGDLNDNTKQALRAIKEQQDQKIQSYDIEPNAILTAAIKDDAVTMDKIADGSLPTGVTVASANIVDGTIVNADINASAAIAGTKISPNFGSQVISTTGNITVGGTVDGRDIANDGTKLDSIETGATADQTNAEIKTAYEANADTNAFQDAEKTKLAGIESGATADQTAAEIRAAVEAASDSNVFTDADHSKLNAIEAGATADQTNAEIKTAYEANADTNAFQDAEKTKLAGIETAATADQTDAEIKTAYENNSNTNAFTDAEKTKLSGIETAATADQTNAEIKTAYEANANTNEFSDAEQTKLANIETAATADQTASEIKTLLQSDKLTLSEINTTSTDSRYFTETELTNGALDGRYYTETEAEARFLRQDSSETIASGVTWSSTDDKVATTAAIDLRVIELVDDVGGFVPIANETSFPTENPDINTSGTAKGGTIVSVAAASTNLTPSGTTVTIANGRGTGNAVIITDVPTTIPQGFGFLVETTATDHTYSFHRLVPKATEVTTVAANAVNIAAAGANVTSIDNFADRYQISNNAPTARPDSSNLALGDLWFDSSSNKVMMVYDASAGDGFSPITPNQATLTNINIVAGHVTFQEDLGNITDAINTGSGNNSVNTVGSNIANVNTAATNIAKITTVADDLNESTSEIDTVATNIANVNIVGNAITNVNNVGNSIGNVNTVHGSLANVNTAATNIASINTAASNISNVNNFTDLYQIDSSDPAQDGGGNNLAQGDLYFNTTSNELRVYNGGSWQGGVTATGNLAGLGANTFTGNQSHGDNVKNTFGTGNDLEIFHTGSQSTIQSSNVNNFTIRQKDSNGFLFIHGDQLNLRSQTDNDLYFSAVNGGTAKIYFDNSEKLQTTSTGVTVTGLMTATTIDGAAGNNLQLDFGTL